MKMRGIKCIPIVLVFLPGMAIAGGALTPSTLLANVTQYDHQHVAVAGMVSDIQPHHYNRPARPVFYCLGYISRRLKKDCNS